MLVKKFKELKELREYKAQIEKIKITEKLQELIDWGFESLDEIIRLLGKIEKLNMDNRSKENIKRDKAIFKAIYFEGKTYKEVAEKYNLSTSRIQQICWKICRRIKDARHLELINNQTDESEKELGYLEKISMGDTRIFNCLCRRLHYDLTEDVVKQLIKNKEKFAIRNFGEKSFNQLNKNLKRLHKKYRLYTDTNGKFYFDYKKAKPKYNYKTGLLKKESDESKNSIDKLREDIYVAKIEHGITQYEIAEKLGISRFKLCRLLQRELTIPQQKKIAQALTELIEEKSLLPLEEVKL